MKWLSVARFGAVLDRRSNRMSKREKRVLIRSNYNAFLRVACLENLEYFSGVLHGLLQAYLISGVINFEQYKRYQALFDRKYRERKNEL